MNSTPVSSAHASLRPLHRFFDVTPDGAPGSGIPETFTAEQVESILAMNTTTGDRNGVAQQLKVMTPTRFTAAQAECIRELLMLDRRDFHATLADAMEPCALRNQLRARRIA